ncbi:MAG: hypothetical protein KC425_10410 [Anaerolineales bacterium]|nr:hypothetical protein [Anaerolineales bacterium]
MSDDFANEFRNSYGDQQGPDWLQDLEEEEMAAPAGADDMDEFDRLRQQSARASAAQDDLTYEVERSSSSGGFSLSQFSPGQRLVLGILVLLNVIVGGVALLALVGIIG